VNRARIGYIIMVDNRTRLLQQQSTALVTTNLVHPTDDIVAERQRASFDGTSLMRHLNGGQEKLDKRCGLRLVLAPHAVPHGDDRDPRRAKLAEALSKTSWGDKSKRHYLTREQEYVQALQAALGIWYATRHPRPPRDLLSADDDAGRR
jgi:acyl-CoA oxidase